jgi:hypothetical protein
MTHTRSIKAPFTQLGAALTLVAAVYSAPLRAEPAEHSFHGHLHRVGSSAAEGAGEASEVNGSPESKVRYTCPMHPEVVSEAPGRCPHCGMKLVEDAAPELWRQA